MRRFTVGIFGVLIVAGAVLSSQQGRSTATMTEAQQDLWKTELSNWGRWGEDDQVGAINLITPSKRRQAAALVQEGFSVSLARDAETEQAVDVADPYEHVMLRVGADRIGVAFHGQAHTHLDSLAHVFLDGKGYNGYAPVEAEVMEAGGHTRNSIHNLKNGVFTRGVLIDIPRLKGVPYLGSDTPIYIEDLEAWEQKAGVRVTAGDALFVRTGRWARRAAVGPWDVGSGASGQRPGLHPSVLPWLKQRDIALLGSDIPQSFNPGGASAALAHAGHNFPLAIMGVHLFDNVDLEAVAEAAAARNRWEFLLTAAPLPIRGGTGSPVNPIATF